jgi:hypothetical protein
MKRSDISRASPRRMASFAEMQARTGGVWVKADYRENYEVRFIAATAEAMLTGVAESICEMAGTRGRDDMRGGGLRCCWEHAKPAELKVYVTLVIHLRELIEAGKMSPPEPDRDFDDEEDSEYDV